MIPKFREWDAERENIMPGKGMSYGTREDSDDAFLIRFDHMEDLDLVNNDGSIDRVVMMSTGLKDKNGVEIYEGDVLKGPMDFGPGGWIESVAPVCYHKIHGYQLHYFLLEHTEVIGNRYEHPHLLEE